MIPHGNHFKVFPTGAGVMHEVMFCIFNVCWFSCLTLSLGAEWFPWPTAHTCCPSDATPGGDASDHDITMWCSSSRYEQFWRWCYIFFSTTYSTYSWRVATPTLRAKKARLCDKDDARSPQIRVELDGMSGVRRGNAGKFIELNGGISSRPRLIAGWYMHGWCSLPFCFKPFLRDTWFILSSPVTSCFDCWSA